MRYTVVWLPDAETRLTDLYNRAPDKQAVTEAADGHPLARTPERFPTS